MAEEVVVSSIRGRGKWSWRGEESGWSLSCLDRVVMCYGTGDSAGSNTLQLDVNVNGNCLEKGGRKVDLGMSNGSQISS